MSGERDVAESLRRRLAFEELIAAISARFIRSSAETLDEGIHEALAEIGAFSGADRSYVFLLRPDDRTFDNTHEWCAEGIEPQIGRLQGIPADLFPWWMQRLRRLENVIIPDVGGLPPEAASEKRLLESQRVRSLVSVPILREGSFAGFAGFDWVRSGNPCEPDEVRLLRMVGDIIGSALQRKRIVAELRQAESMLQQSQKLEAMGRMAGSIAHDFNNLLTAMLGFGELALARMDSGLPARQQIEEIVGAAEKASALTRQLLAFSRRQAIEPRRFDLNATVREMERLLARLVGAKVEIRFELCDEPSFVLADPGQIEQVIMNLAVNAADAMPGGGRLTFRTRPAVLDETRAGATPGARAGSHVRLEVEDTGCGMDDATIARIFEPFFTTKEAERGTGLGLATVYGIVRQCGGTIEVSSRPGEGTVFGVCLPAAAGDRRDVTTREIRSAPASGAGETILVVEDDDGVRGLLRQTLTSAGYRVEESASGADALVRARARAGAIDLVLADTASPPIGGDALLGRLEALLPRAALILMTGTGEARPLPSMLRDRGVVRIVKPFSPAGLLATVREALESARAAQRVS